MDLLKGKIDWFDVSLGEGMISCENGNRYRFGYTKGASNPMASGIGPEILIKDFNNSLQRNYNGQISFSLSGGRLRPIVHNIQFI